MTTPNRPTIADALAYDKAEFMSKMGLEQNEDGTATAFISAREHAWHGLGTVMPENFTVADAMKLAHLGDWNVRKLPIYATEITEEGVNNIEVPDRFAIVRTNPFTKETEPLTAGQGNQYTPIQNEDHGDFLLAVTHESGAVLETAGSLQNGKRVFFSMKLPETMQVGGIDAVDMYLIVQNYHDGTGAFTGLISPIRPVCQNTLNAAVGGAVNKIKIRHTRNAKLAVVAAQEALGLTFKYAEAFEAEANKMIEATISEGQFVKSLRKIWAAPKGEDATRAATIHAERESKIVMLFNQSPTIQEAIKGTKWGAYQAVTEYLDHYAPANSKKGTPEAVRAERVASGSLDAVKTLAFAQLSVR